MMVAFMKVLIECREIQRIVETFSPKISNTDFLLPLDSWASSPLDPCSPTLPERVKESIHTKIQKGCVIWKVSPLLGDAVISRHHRKGGKGNKCPSFILFHPSIDKAKRNQRKKNGFDVVHICVDHPPMASSKKSRV